MGADRAPAGGGLRLTRGSRQDGGAHHPQLTEIARLLRRGRAGAQGLADLAQCGPLLVGDPRAKSELPDNVRSVMEIIINGHSLQAIIDATQAAIAASVNTPGLLRISAGNYNGRLGKSFIYLHPDKQPL